MRITAATVYLDLCAEAVFDSAEKYEEHRRQWGGGLRGNKSTEKLKKRAKAAGTTLATASKL